MGSKFAPDAGKVSSKNHTIRLIRRSRTLPIALACGVLLAAANPRSVGAQLADALSDSASISLITVLPGEPVYSLFGHSAVRVRDPEQGMDLSFSYGTFHFDDPLFVPKFARGKLDYYLSVTSFGNALRFYREVEGRPVIEQVLALDAEDRGRLFDFLRQNALPENRYYRYDFLFDNCSTRIRDALEQVFADRVAFSDTMASDGTFRELLAPYLRERTFLGFGIDLALGARLERVASAREATFLPDYLSTWFDTGVLRDAAGSVRPLVASRDTILWLEGYSRPQRSTPWSAISLTLLCAAVALLTLRESRRGRAKLRIDVVLFGLVGLAGCFLLFMWFGTDHRVTATNWNLTWAWPIHLIYAGVLARTGLTRVTALYATFAAAAMVILVGTWSLLPQDLPEPALAVAVMIAMRGTWLTLYARRAGGGTPEPRSTRS